MYKNYTFFMLLLTAILFPCHALASDDATTAEDTMYVVKKDGSVDIFPMSTVERHSTSSGELHITTKGGNTFSYGLEDLESYDHQLDIRRPTITSFKFNNKFNHQVFTDVECEITDDHRITGDMTAVGHWLTPSFKRSDKRAVAYLDGKEQLVSKRSRTKFGTDHTLTIAYPGMNILQTVKISEGEDGTTTIEKTPIALTAEMLSTNAPSNYPEREGLEMMLDDDPSTFFHSTWGTGAYEKLPEDEAPYIEVTLPEPAHNLVYEITNRSDNASRSPLVLSLLTSADGENWTEAHRFTELNGLVVGNGVTNTSPVVEFEQPVSHVRIVMVQANYKNYFCVAELKLYTATVHSDGGTDDVYEEQMVPFGTDYALHLDWHTPAVPSVNIDVEYFELPASKTTYNEAHISIDGNGFYPSLESTAVQIKGRGNSSWSSNSYSKNPYRLKFSQKMKPFGLKGGKSWVLLANRQSGSMLTNAIGMYAAGLIGADGANHIIPVELYMNGDYWGSYNFTEKVGLSNNSIDLTDETKACMIELDTYTDEQIYRSSPYSLPVKIKDPDFTDPTSTELTSKDDVMNRFNLLAKAVRDGEDITEYTDVESLARFLMVNELILNYEIMHPKSSYLYHENVLEDSCKWKWGPVWDLDWSYGYEGGGGYYISRSSDKYWTGVSGNGWGGQTFFNRLRHSGEEIDRAMYKYWTRFMQLYLEELIDYCDEYYAFAKPSIENNNNAYYWSDKDYTNYATNVNNAKRWLRQRATVAFAQQTPYDLTEEEIMGITEEDEDEVIDDTPFYTDGIERTHMATRFDVYDLRGVKLKAGARFNDWRNGLQPGLYIVNGKKVLVP